MTQNNGIRTNSTRKSDPGAAKAVDGMMEEIVRPKFKTAYDPTDDHPGFQCVGPSLTKQEFKDDCDINNIIGKFARTGELMVQAKTGVFDDFSEPLDYRAALDTVIEARHQFDLLPAAVRDRFGNDPEKFLAFATNPSNAEEMAELGLMKPEAKERVKNAKDAALMKQAEARVKAEAEKASRAAPEPK